MGLAFYEVLYIWYSNLLSLTPRVFIIIVAILQMKKLMLGEVKLLPQGHSSGTWQCWHSTPGPFDVKSPQLEPSCYPALTLYLNSCSFSRALREASS